MVSGGAATAIAIVLSGTPAFAQTVQQYEIPERDLASALKAFAATSGREVIAPSSILQGKRSTRVTGLLSADQALLQLLGGTGLRFAIVDGAFIIRAANAGAQNAQTQVESEIIVVTGSRIRGAPIASPVITLTREAIRNAGQASLGEVVRSIPQSFAGGQQPGIGFNVPAINGVDVGGGSSINLRGLGSDATLTLLNGRRVAYSGSRQSIDVSTIPLGALERIEIVADGASALYGSDAVGGVANIILRRDMDGFETRGRLATSTDGGNFQRQASATGGARWAKGGFIAAYEFNDNSAVESADRDYARTRSPGLTLFPSARNHNALVSGHQRLGEAFELSVDALYNNRRNQITYATNPAGDLAVSRAEQVTRSEAYAVSPRLEMRAGGGWTVALQGGTARDRVNYRIDRYAGDSAMLLGAGCYCNGAWSIEAVGDGPLFRLPAGDAKIALGAGYREISLENDRGPQSPLNFTRSQGNRFVYGELALPIASPHLELPAAHRLSLSAAVRYEDFDAAGSVATPKLGIVYAPSALIDLKASWGRSFRVATLIQRYQPPALTLIGAGVFGATEAPPEATALYIQGGNAALRPERATTWSVTADVHPLSIPELSFEISYFEVRYLDRIVTPIGFITAALSDPIYAPQITLDPSAQQLDAILASGASFVNATGVPFDPDSVIAFIDNSNVNAGRQQAHGVDILLGYEIAMGPSDTLLVGANASYLESDRQISPDQPTLPLAGILFNPPNWRGRGTASWTSGDFSLTAAANYTGPLRDTRPTAATQVPSQWRFDLHARYVARDASPAWLEGLELGVGVDNVFNAEPPPITTGAITDTPYDSTNFSPLGRVISVSIAKRW